MKISHQDKDDDKNNLVLALKAIIMILTRLTLESSIPLNRMFGVRVWSKSAFGFCPSLNRIPNNNIKDKYSLTTVCFITIQNKIWSGIMSQIAWMFMFLFSALVCTPLWWRHFMTSIFRPGINAVPSLVKQFYSTTYCSDQAFIWRYGVCWTLSGGA